MLAPALVPPRPASPAPLPESRPPCASPPLCPASALPCDPWESLPSVDASGACCCPCVGAAAAAAVACVFASCAASAPARNDTPVPVVIASWSASGSLISGTPRSARISLRVRIPALTSIWSACARVKSSSSLPPPVAVIVSSGPAPMNLRAQSLMQSIRKLRNASVANCSLWSDCCLPAAPPPMLDFCVMPSCDCGMPNFAPICMIRNSS